MAASDYKLSITGFDWKDSTHKQIDLEFEWPGLLGTERDYTDKFEVYVKYHIVNNAGERRILREDPATTIEAVPGEGQYRFYWNVPDECIEVQMSVWAYSKTFNRDGNEIPYWNTGLIRKTEYVLGEKKEWTDLFYTGDAHKPDKAETPTVTQDPRLGSQVLLELENIREEEGNNSDITKVEFQILSVQNDFEDGTIIAGEHEAIVSEFNTCRYKFDIGNEYGYRFRARYWASEPGEFEKIQGDKWAPNASPVVSIAGEWSDLTEVVYGVPNAPVLIQDQSIKKQNSTQMLMTFEVSGHAHHYQLQIATSTAAFSRMDEWEAVHPDLIENETARKTALIQTPPVNTEITTASNDPYILITKPQTASGMLYYRIRSVSAESGGYYSGWSNTITFQFDEPLGRPMVWMNTPFANVGDNSIVLNIMHNSPTGSAPTGAFIAYKINSGGPTYYYPPRDGKQEGILPPPSSGNTFQVAFPLLDYPGETSIVWWAYTSEYGEAGTPESERHWSPSSEWLTFYIYEKATLNITFPDIPESEWIPVLIDNGNGTAPVLTSFPFHFRVDPVLGGDQKITSYFIRIISCEAYYITDGYGNREFINKGTVLYSAYDSESPTSFDRYLNVSDVTLANGQVYELNVVAYINTGATAEASAKFTVDLAKADYVIEASLSQNRDTVSMGINPMVSIYTMEAGTPVAPPLTPYVPDGKDAMIYFDSEEKLTDWASTFHLTPESYIAEVQNGVLWLKMSTPDRTPVAPEPLYGADTDEYMIYFKTVEEEAEFAASLGLTVEEFEWNLAHETLYLDYATKRELAENVDISIYRKNQDGTMTEIAKDLPNQTGIFITDPHPHLRDNVYRIVARSTLTGAMTFYDTPPFTMECTDIVIQWDENYGFDIGSVANDLPSQYAGNMIRLPYNIDVSESAGVENAMVKYIGRKDPVSYYGTQTGYTATWNTVIPKYEREIIAMLRKLQVYPGNVYVREPSGTGYWANVKVTFPINHVELTVSVSLTITRVEGGI